jgi:hypothetical protein
MDFTRNIDKLLFGTNDLYNSVLQIQVSNEGAEPVTLQEAKDWGKIEQTVDDSIVTALITAARRVCETFSGIGFIERDLVVGLNNSNGGMTLPFGPVTSTPTALDVYGNALTLTYELGQIMYPMCRMQISYSAGYATLPEDLKTALKCQFLYLYENRGESSELLSPIAKMILEPQRTIV